PSPGARPFVGRGGLLRRSRRPGGHARGPDVHRGHVGRGGTRLRRRGPRHEPHAPCAHGHDQDDDRQPHGRGPETTNRRQTCPSCRCDTTAVRTIAFGLPCAHRLPLRVPNSPMRTTTGGTVTLWAAAVVLGAPRSGGRR